MAGTSYTRQSTLTDGDTITAALFNDEYNKLVSAFAYTTTGTTGHRHDGTTAEGGNIHTIGDQDFLNKIVADSTNNRWGVYVQVSGSAVEQIRIQDGAIVPVTDSDIDLGTSSLEFKDGFFDGTIHVDTLDVDANATVAGTLAVTGNTTVGGTLTVTGTTAFNGGTLTLGDSASDNVVFGADINSDIIPNTDSAFDLGSSSQEWRDLYLDGTAHIDTLDVDVNATVAGTLGVTGVLTGTSLDISGDIDVAGTTNLDVVDIDGAVDMATTLAVAGNVDFNGDLDVDGVTNLDVVDIDGAVNMATTLLVTGNVDFNGDLDVDGTTNLDVVDIDGAVNMATTLLVTGNVDFNGDLDVDGVTNLDIVDIDGAVDIATTLTVGGNVDFNGDLDVDGTLETDALTIAGVTLSETIADTVGAMVASNTETGIAVTYDDADNTLDFVIGDNSIVQSMIADDAIDSQMYVDGSIDLVHMSANSVDSDQYVNGSIDTAHIADSQITSAKIADGTIATGDIANDAVTGAKLANNIDIAGTLDVTGLLTADANVVVAGNLTVNGTTTTLNTATLDVEDKNITINYGAGDTSGSANGAGITIQDAVDASNNATILWDTTNDEFDFSHPINVAGKVTSTGTSVFASLDISGDIDVDGTTNLDVVDIDGAVDMASTLQVDGAATFTTEITANGGIALGDNDKATFGAGDDLQIYHDGSHSHIRNTTGNLYLQDDSYVEIGSPSGEVYIGAVKDGAVNLRFDNAIKLATTSTGIDVTGTVTATGTSVFASLDISGDIDVDGTTNLDVVDIDGAVDMASTLAVAGVVTANAGVVVDNFTLDGTTLALSSGDMTLDVAGDIILDADGGNVKMVDGGVVNLDIYKYSSNVYIENPTSDSDIIFSGSDGGTPITALTLDMSAAGAATFNSSITTSGIIKANTSDGLGSLQLDVGGTNKAIVGLEPAVGGGSANDLSIYSRSGALRFWANGAEKLTIATDGAATFSGSVTATSLDISGDIDVDGTTNLDVVDIDGAVDMASTLQVAGNIGIGIAPVTAYGAVLHVHNATNSNIRLTNNTSSSGTGSGYELVASGLNAYLINREAGDLYFYTNNLSRFAIASDGSLSTPTLGTSNVRFGVNAGNSIVSGGNYNVVVGDEAGTALTTGDYNVFVGYAAGDANQIASRNVGVGIGALGSNVSAGRNVAIGNDALTSFATTGDTYNTAIGSAAGAAVSAATGQTLIGGLAGDANTTALNLTAVGYQALTTYNRTDSADSKTVAVGMNAFRALTTGTQNTAVGMQAGDNQLGAANSTFVGYRAGYNVTTGESNTFVGSLCGDATDDGLDNTAIGVSALSGNCGNENTALGKDALLISTAGRNTAIGWGAGNSNTSGGGNIFIGYDCAAYANNSTTGVDNTYIGAFARGSSSTVSSEMAIGRYCLGQGESTATLGLNGNGATISLDGSDTSWAAHSDERLKENITSSTAGLSFINDLRPVTYNWKAKNAISTSFTNYYDADSTDPVNGVEGNTYHGFIAQEMKATIDSHSEVENGNNLWAERVDDIQQLAPSNLVPMLTKAIQELSAQVDALTARITTLEG